MGGTCLIWEQIPSGRSTLTSGVPVPHQSVWCDLSYMQEVDGIGLLMNEFALESVGVMFIGTKLGVLQGAQDGQQLIRYWVSQKRCTFFKIDKIKRMTTKLWNSYSVQNYC